MILRINESWYPVEDARKTVMGVEMSLKEHDRFDLALIKTVSAVDDSECFIYQCSLPQLCVKNRNGEEIAQKIPFAMNISNAKWVIENLVKQYHELTNKRYSLALQFPDSFDAALLGYPLIDAV
jgi:hypothetical protein